MIKKLLLSFFLILTLSVVIYPTKKENIKLFDYCQALEKILSSNTLKKRKNVTGNVNSISKDIAKFGVSKTRGALIDKMINKYKTSKNNFIITLIPNKLYCLAGYWIENLNPGTFESILYEKSNKAINEFKDFKNEFDDYLKDINSEYKSIEKEFNNIFK